MHVNVFRLCTCCDNAPHGCNAVLKLDSLASHLIECTYLYIMKIICISSVQHKKIIMSQLLCCAKTVYRILAS